MEGEKKGGWSFGKILLIIIVLIFAMLIMQKMGVKVVKTTEKSEMTDDPHPGY
jgi:cell division protein FtsI/penicillin-binding protein 2